MNEMAQWRRTNPWLAAQYQQYTQFPAPSINLASFARTGTEHPQVRAEITDRSSGVADMFKSPARPCDQCNGDCTNYLCYGCGGCSEPPPEQQTYYYPYQKKDAAYHDAFAGHAMELSGLVMFPLPKIYKASKGVSKSNIAGKSKITDDNDDNEDSDDDDDSDDDFDDSDGDLDDDGDADNDIPAKKKTKGKKGTVYFL